MLPELEFRRVLVRSKDTATARCYRDWSSDVCSSDLSTRLNSKDGIRDATVTGVQTCAKIGRASCRERVEISVGAVSLKKKKKTWTRAPFDRTIVPHALRAAVRLARQ